MNKFIYSQSIPGEIKAEIEKYLNPLGWLVPGWCQRIFVEWAEGNDQNAAICCSTSYEYRQITLTFFPSWHTGDEEHKSHMVAHDLLHAFTAPLSDYANELICTLLPEEESPKYRKSALEELRVRHESFVQDLSFSITRKLA